MGWTRLQIQMSIIQRKPFRSWLEIYKLFCSSLLWARGWANETLEDHKINQRQSWLYQREDGFKINHLFYQPQPRRRKWTAVTVWYLDVLLILWEASVHVFKWPAVLRRQPPSLLLSDQVTMLVIYSPQFICSPHLISSLDEMTTLVMCSPQLINTGMIWTVSCKIVLHKFVRTHFLIVMESCCTGKEGPRDGLLLGETSAWQEKVLKAVKNPSLLVN